MAHKKGKKLMIKGGHTGGKHKGGKKGHKRVRKGGKKR